MVEIRNLDLIILARVFVLFSQCDFMVHDERRIPLLLMNKLLRKSSCLPVKPVMNSQRQLCARRVFFV